MAGIPPDVRILRTFHYENLFLDVGINENIPNFGRGLVLFIRGEDESENKRRAISKAYSVMDNDDEELRKAFEVIEELLRIPGLVVVPKGIDKAQILEILEHAEEKLDQEL